jgi:hypothetical protein
LTADSASGWLSTMPMKFVGAVVRLKIAHWLLRLLGHTEHDSRALAARPAVTHIRY